MGKNKKCKNNLCKNLKNATRLKFDIGSQWCMDYLLLLVATLMIHLYTDILFEIM